MLSRTLYKLAVFSKVSILKRNSNQPTASETVERLAQSLMETLISCVDTV